MKRSSHPLSQRYDTGTLELDTCFAIWQEAKPKSLLKTALVQRSGENYTWSRRDWVPCGVVRGFVGSLFSLFVGACFCCF